MKKAILTSFMLFTTLFCIAQASIESRIEFKVENGYQIQEILDFGDKGFVIYSLSQQNQIWRYELFDNNLKSIKKHELSAPYKKNHRYYTRHTKNSIHMFHIDKKKGNYTITSIAIPSMEITKVEGSFPEDIWVRTEVMGDYFFVSVNESGRKPSRYFFTINWKTGEKKSISKLVSHIDINKTYVEQLMAINQKQLVVDVSENKKTNDKYFIYFNDEGKKIKELKLENMGEHKIVDINTCSINDNQYAVAGTYSKKNLSEGIFFNFSTDDKINLSKKYKFTELNNFFSYLSEKKQEKIEKKQAAGKSINKNYLIAMHDVIPLKDGYILMGEAYYPTYTRRFTTTSSSAMEYVFNGYRYTHAVILKFDKQGSFEWDRTFKMRIAQKPFVPMKFINTTEKSDDYIKLIFGSNDFIVSKKIGFDGEILQDDKSQKIEIPDLGSRKEWTFSTMTYWYDDYFLSYGQQRIVAKKSKKGEKIQTIFFAHKIKYE